MIKRTIKNFVIWIMSIFTPTETIVRSQDKWDDLARKNARYYVLTDQGEQISEQDFRAAGRRDYQKYIVNDELLKDKLSPFSGKKVLEIGAGLGRITEFIAEEFYDVCAVDISAEMVKRGQERLGERKNVHFFATDGVSYPFSDNLCNLVFSFITFQHMPSADVVRKNFQEIGRVLKPGGIAKIQLRGVPVKKASWFYGPAFTVDSLTSLIGRGLSVVKTEGEGTKYFWVWLEKIRN